MHYHTIEDKDGDTVDAIPYCSDFCNKEGQGDKYRGWNGCHEGADYDQECANCGEVIRGLDYYKEQDCSHEWRECITTDGVVVAHSCNKCGAWKKTEAGLLTSE